MGKRSRGRGTPAPPQKHAHTRTVTETRSLIKGPPLWVTRIRFRRAPLTITAASIYRHRTMTPGGASGTPARPSDTPAVRHGAHLRGGILGGNHGEWIGDHTRRTQRHQLFVERHIARSNHRIQIARVVAAVCAPQIVRHQPASEEFTFDRLGEHRPQTYIWNDPRSAMAWAASKHLASTALVST